MNILLIHKKIHQMAFFLLGNYHDACDLTQEVFFELEKGRKKWEKSDSKLAWAMGVFHCQFKRFLRLKSAHKSQELQEDTSTKNSVEDVLVTEEKLQKTMEELRKMNKDLAEALWLFSHEQMSIKEIASLQNCPTGTVKWRIFEARRILASQIKE